MRKRSIPLAGSRLTFNPDLAFEGRGAVGDVKYKISDGEWDRADLYQSIAFAEAASVRRSLILRFREPGTRGLEDLVVGTKSIHEVTWRADPAVSAAHAAREVSEAVERWLTEPAGTLPTQASR